MAYAHDAIRDSYTRQTTATDEYIIINIRKLAVFTQNNVRQTTTAAERIIVNDLYAIRDCYTR